jgi:hypothetical protein
MTRREAIHIPDSVYARMDVVDRFDPAMHHPAGGTHDR